jgi:hypothetical protein
MTPTTLAGVRELVEHHVPPEVREKSTWQYLVQQLAETAAGADSVHVSIVLRWYWALKGLSAAPDEGDRPAGATALGVSPWELCSSCFQFSLWQPWSITADQKPLTAPTRAFVEYHIGEDALLHAEAGLIWSFYVFSPLETREAAWGGFLAIHWSGAGASLLGDPFAHAKACAEANG